MGMTKLKMYKPQLKIKATADDIEKAKNQLGEDAIRKLVREEMLKEMDYQKLLPIQIQNVAALLGGMRQANATGKVGRVKQYYMQMYKLVVAMKKSIDGLE